MAFAGWRCGFIAWAVVHELCASSFPVPRSLSVPPLLWCSTSRITMSAFSRMYLLRLFSIAVCTVPVSSFERAHARAAACLQIKRMMCCSVWWGSLVIVETFGRVPRRGSELRRVGALLPCSPLYDERPPSRCSARTASGSASSCARIRHDCVASAGGGLAYCLCYVNLCSCSCSWFSCIRQVCTMSMSLTAARWSSLRDIRCRYCTARSARVRI